MVQLHASAVRQRMPDCISLAGLVGSMPLIRTIVKTAPEGLSHWPVSPMRGDRPRHVDGANLLVRLSSGRSDLLPTSSLWRGTWLRLQAGSGARLLRGRCTKIGRAHV